MKYYAVRSGRHVGVYATWEACRAQVDRFPGAQYKAFSTKKEAEAFAFPQKHAPPLSNAPSSKSLPKPHPDRHLNHIDIWVDGSCIQQPGRRLHLGWAYLVMDGDHEVHRASGNDIPRDAVRHRNVAGEIIAVLKAVSWCQSQGIRSLTIHHDYQGLASWAVGAWKTNTPLTQTYAQTIKTSGLAIHWNKVRAHSGERGNEVVDQLAKQAALGTAIGEFDGNGEC